VRVGGGGRRVRVVVLADVVVVGARLLVQPLRLAELGATVLEPDLRGINVTIFIKNIFAGKMGTNRTFVTQIEGILVHRNVYIIVPLVFKKVANFFRKK
jgi:hypothetical protein